MDSKTYQYQRQKGLKFAIMTRNQHEEEKKMDILVQNPNKVTNTTDTTTTSRHEATESVLNRKLYPPRSLLRNGTLPLEDSLHSLYYEVYGPANTTAAGDHRRDTSKEKAIALSLHGGPGAGCFPKHAQFFDPERYSRVILFDQRGCGRSTPRGETRENTLQLLVEDIETLRKHLEVDVFDVVLGGSWGSTLALAYAQSFPRRVGSIVLRGICLFRSREIDWLFGNRVDDDDDDVIVDEQDDDTRRNEKTFCMSNKKELACEWENFANGTVSKSNVDDHDDDKKGAHDENDDDKRGTRRVLHRYYNALLGSNPVARVMVARSWMQWEMSVGSLSIELDAREQDFGHVIVWNGAKRIWTVNPSNSQHIIETGQCRQMKNLDLLRKWPKLASDSTMLLSSSRQTEIRPVISTGVDCQHDDAKDKSQTDAYEAAKKYIPAQAMLTCFYSVNQEVIMENFDLLKKENIDRIRHIPCIAVQGAKDLICPPDSALDLVEAWPEMECRIVTKGKHSMYDSNIMSELIQATDDVADFLSKNNSYRRERVKKNIETF